jgi:hypothetical protein
MGLPFTRLWYGQLPGERLAYGAVQMCVDPIGSAPAIYADEP